MLYSCQYQLDEGKTDMTAERVGENDRSRLLVGRQIRRWRTERGLTLARVAERSGLTVGYLSQVENDKASPSLAVLGQIAEALDVSPAWFLMDDTPPPRVVRAKERPVTTSDMGRIEHVDGRTSRDVSIIEVSGKPGGRVGAHAHPGDEHHIVLRGRMRLTQGEHTIEVGPGDYVRWDGSIPHDGEVMGDQEAAMLIVRIRPPT
jgi:transcriptional regulator with XRE-family HTH domain